MALAQKGIRQGKRPTTSTIAKSAKPVAVAKKAAKPIPKVTKPVLAAKVKVSAAKAITHDAKNQKLELTSSAGLARAKPVAKPAEPPLPVATKHVQQIEKAKSALKRESVDVTGAAKKPATAKARSRKISVDVDPNEAASALSQKWLTLYKKAEQIDSKPYNMRAVFEEKTAIMHKILGWGYILANRNDRLEVLFKDGIKYLISNYKP